MPVDVAIQRIAHVAPRHGEGDHLGLIEQLLYRGRDEGLIQPAYLFGKGFRRPAIRDQDLVPRR